MFCYLWLHLNVEKLSFKVYVCQTILLRIITSRFVRSLYLQREETLFFFSCSFNFYYYELEDSYLELQGLRKSYLKLVLH